MAHAARLCTSTSITSLILWFRPTNTNKGFIWLQVHLLATCWKVCSIYVSPWLYLQEFTVCLLRNNRLSLVLLLFVRSCRQGAKNCPRSRMCASRLCVDLLIDLGPWNGESQVHLLTCRRWCLSNDALAGQAAGHAVRGLPCTLYVQMCLRACCCTKPQGRTARAFCILFVSNTPQGAMLHLEHTHYSWDLEHWWPGGQEATNVPQARE